ncbi:MAG: hypothetical protein LBD88_01550 [Candidatus Peribacteria bacterium]|nr:hypothetical protein [Candidatus Peribacteria bacterium]
MTPLFEGITILNINYSPFFSVVVSAFFSSFLLVGVSKFVAFSSAGETCVKSSVSLFVVEISSFVSSIGVIVASILSHSTLTGTSIFISSLGVSQTGISETFVPSVFAVSSFLGVAFFKSQTEFIHFVSNSFLAASKNLASADIGDFIEPTSLESKVSFVGREARTFVSSIVFNSPSNIEIDHTSFPNFHLGQFTSFINIFTLLSHTIESSLEQTIQICHSSELVSTSISKASFKAFLIIVFLAKV